MSEARDRLRAATLGRPAFRQSRTLEWHGEKYELRRPTLKEQRQIDEASVIGIGKKAKKDGVKALMHALVRCVFVPGTEERVFDPHDIDAMEDRGTEDFVGVFATAIGELAEEANPEDIEKNSEGAQTAAL